MYTCPSCLNTYDYASSYKESVCSACRYAKLDPRAKLIYPARKRAKSKGMECTITVDDFVIPEYCPLLGIKIESAKGQGNTLPCSPSLDRIDPTKGYIPGNVRVISYKANTMKNDATAAELFAFAENIVDYLLSSAIH